MYPPARTARAEGIAKVMRKHACAMKDRKGVQWDAFALPRVGDPEEEGNIGVTRHTDCI